MTAFSEIGLREPLVRAVTHLNYERMTPIQAQAIPPLLEGRDVMGCAQTGTGKTAAFLLPMLHHLTARPPRGKPRIKALILTPTRELAAQIGENLSEYAQFTDVRHQVIFGGVNQRPQVSTLKRGVHMLVATPGRLLDLCDQGFIDLSDVDFFVLDEADRMLDMGFIRDIRKVLNLLPKQRQNLLFSATMPDSIVALADGFLNDPVRVEVDPQSTTVERIEQQVYFVERPNKRRLLCQLLTDSTIYSAIVFTRTKHGANRVVKFLTRDRIEAAAIHGNKSQGARERALAGFRDGKIRVLVATDIASRGIDVDGVSHVFNFDLPNISESYVHRIGRTARAGRDGIAISFCDESETDYLRDIERLIDKELTRVMDHEWHHEAAIPVPADNRGRSTKRQARKSTPQGSRSENAGAGASRRRSGGRRRSPQRDESSNQSTGDSTAQGPSAQSEAGKSESRSNRRRRRRRPSGEGAQPDRSAGVAPSNAAASGTKRRRRRRRRPSGQKGPSSDS